MANKLQEEPLETAPVTGADEEPEEEEEEDDKEVVSREVLSAEERLQRRLARKPDVSRLSPGVVDGAPVFDKGSRVVVERRISFVPGTPWLDTCVYIVQHVDLANGIVSALEDEHGTRHFLSFKDKHHDWYL